MLGDKRLTATARSLARGLNRVLGIAGLRLLRASHLAELEAAIRQLELVDEQAKRLPEAGHSSNPLCVVPLDQPPSSDYRPRWGYSCPPHAGLWSLFERNKYDYAEVIDGLRRMAPFLADISREFTSGPRPGWIGGPFTALDLSLVYYFVCQLKPRTYVEIGSGFTTCFARQAARDHGISTRLICIDQHPLAWVSSIAEVVHQGLETADLGIFSALRAGDIVFVDGSHRCFMNSDATVFILDVLPRLDPGIVVQFHDTFLPYDYPESFKSRYWNEQYALAAYLLGASNRVRILMPSHFVTQVPELRECLLPPPVDLGSEDAFLHGGSLWFTHAPSDLPSDPATLYAGVSRDQYERQETSLRPSPWKSLTIQVRTEKPVAVDSPDHIIPWGTKNDNSTRLTFNLKLARWIPPERLTVLDLGCAGGGFVRSVLEMGCLAVGIEGSDYSKIRGRAEWARIPSHLFTADISEPFEVLALEEGQPARRLRFAVITAWEVLEHIRSAALAKVFRNIDAHLEPQGVFIASVSPNEEVIEGVRLHQTVQPREWWLEEARRNGFQHHSAILDYFGDDWIRWERNAPGSFHLVLARVGEPLPYAERLPDPIRSKLHT